MNTASRSWVGIAAILIVSGCDPTGGGDYGVINGHTRQWCDDTSGLCWSDPPTDAQQTRQEALNLCAELEIDGDKDWRMPAIEELIGLIRGCQSTACNLSQDGCADLECYDPICDGCEYLSGPGEDGCYWPDELKQGLCLEFWSTTNYTQISSDGDVEWTFTVGYSQGNIFLVRHETGYASTRCVRDVQ